ADRWKPHPLSGRPRAIVRGWQRLARRSDRSATGPTYVAGPTTIRLPAVGVRRRLPTTSAEYSTGHWVVPAHDRPGTQYSFAGRRGSATKGHLPESNRVRRADYHGLAHM